jgi:hypothetical protein
MASAVLAPAALTEDELRAAFERLRGSKRTTWPATFEEAMKDRLFAALITLNAKHPPRATVRPARGSIKPATQPPPNPRPWRTSAQPGAIDRKRAAAGERDDD